MGRTEREAPDAEDGLISLCLPRVPVGEPIAPVLRSCVVLAPLAVVRSGVEETSVEDMLLQEARPSRPVAASKSASFIIMRKVLKIGEATSAASP